MSAGIDLTSLGAVGDMPPKDHPIFDGPIQQASDIVSLDIAPEAMALKLETLTARMGILEERAWTAPTLTLVQVRPNTTRMFLLVLLLTLLAVRLAKSSQT